MSDFIFENEDQLPLADCGAEAIGVVNLALYHKSNVVECLSPISGGWEVFTFSHATIEDVFRVLAKPYTLDDAKSEIGGILDKMTGFELCHKAEIQVCLEKLAASMGGGK